MEVFDEWGQTPLSIASAVITAKVNALELAARILRKSTAELLLKLGAKPLAESGVEMVNQLR